MNGYGFRLSDAATIKIQPDRSWRAQAFALAAVLAPLDVEARNAKWAELVQQFVGLQTRDGRPESETRAVLDGLAKVVADFIVQIERVNADAGGWDNG
jgi:hypothetical protein